MLDHRVERPVASNRSDLSHSQSPPRPRVLVVDDDQRLLAALRRGLSLRGFEVGLARDAGQALGYLQGQWPDIIILDIMMPGMDGLALCQLVRENVAVPILMLTARDSVPDRVAGLEAGADDYLVKPFAFDELVARIQALLRRARPEPSKSGRLSYASLVLDRTSWTALYGGEPLDVHGDGRQVRDFVYVSGVVDAVLAGLAIEDSVVWNVASGEATRIVDLATAMATVAGRPLEVRYGPRRSGDVDRSLLSTAALRATRLWGPPLPLAEGLRLTLTESLEVVPLVAAALA
jgi:CheY-like chemotaxis protein